MLNRRVKIWAVSLAMSLAIMSLATGCDSLKKEPKETELQTQSETESESESETETESESETELQTDVAYTSQDRSIRITLPDSTWKVTQDVDEMRVFSSGSAAMINIVHAADAADMKNISISESEDALTDTLTKQYADADAFEVVEFDTLSTDTLDTYEYVVKYNATSMWAYAITYGIVAEDEAYVITGTVTDDNTVLLAAVKKSVESFTVLNNSVFTALSGTVVNEKESETSTKQSESDVDAELKSLTEYGTTATLYASDNVNIRTEPNTNTTENIMGSLNKGDSVTVTGETSQWFRVNINGNVGYISKAFLVSSAPSDSTSTETTQSETQPADSGSMSAAELNSYVDYGTGYTYYTTSDVNFRLQPDTDSNVISTLGSGQAVTVVGETDNWFVVSANGVTGYVSKSYVSSTNTSGGSSGTNTDSGETGGETGGNTGTSSGGTGTVTGTVVDASASTITIQGDDGKTYVVSTSDASVNTTDGLYSGLYVAAVVDYTNSTSGTLHATSVTGY